MGEGLISREQAGTLKRREAESAPAHRVQTHEIFVYLGGLVVFLALAFLVEQNWASLSAMGRILSVLVPTAPHAGVRLAALNLAERTAQTARLSKRIRSRKQDVTHNTSLPRATARHEGEDAQ